MKRIILLIVSFFSLVELSAQAPFSIILEPVNVPNLGGIQSYAFGQDDGKWLIVGGRLDGLHQRQPFAAFDIAGHNNQLIVVDPVSLQKWTAPLSSLPTAIQEQLSSTNMEFYQEGDYLYCLGGYGYSATESDHTTFAKLTAIKVPDVINAIISNSNFSSFFRQISDPQFQVTGGKLKKINNVFHLLGGQKFLGRYNPMGPNHGPGFIQEYTDAIRKFTLSDDGVTITINHLTGFLDAANLHRRDYNAEPQILVNGQEGITMFSGVFQPNVNLPFLNSVTVDTSGYAVNAGFQQYYNHYHCASLPLYSESENEMHTVFFGGIAQYYDDNGTLTQDNDVPFVHTIARVTRDANGVMAEYKLPIEMPSLLGAGSEFIPNKNIAHFNNEVFKLDSISVDSTLVGYIFGGISSTAANIFFSNTGSQSSASSQIFKVLLTNNALTSTDNLNEQSVGSLNVLVYPNPNNGQFLIKYFLKNRSDVSLTIHDVSGKVIDKKVLKNQAVGENIYRSKIKNWGESGTYFLTIQTAYEKATRKIIFN